HHTQIHHYAFISLTFSYIPLLPPLFLFSFTHPSTTEISTLSLHDALPISNIAVWNPTVFRRIPPAQKISLIPVVTEWIKENARIDRKSTRLNSSHVAISYAVFCLKKKKNKTNKLKHTRFIYCLITVQTQYK